MLQLKPSETVPVLLVGLIISYVLYSLIYNLFISPLRSVPGPTLWAVSPIFYTRAILSGQGHKVISQLHEKYGEIVRVAPTQVSIINADVWKDVYGHRKASGQLENNKDPIFYGLQGKGLIGNISSAEHGRQRRILSHAFSAQSMMEQQPLIQGYVDLLITKLKETSYQDGKSVPVDIVKWYNLTTFDVIGDLSFGESFGCLMNTEYHLWVSLIFPALKLGVYLLEARRYVENLDTLLKYTPLWGMLMRKRELRDEITFSKVAQRMDMQGDRPDFMHHMLGKSPDGTDKLALSEIRLNASLLIVAGSETTATALSGVTYLLCTHPEVLAKLTEEVRHAFPSEKDIDLISVNQLEYMLAVLNEGLRLFPAVPGILPRAMHKGGDVVCGTYLPEKTVVNNWQWAMYRHSNHFYMAGSFIPERWLQMGDERFVNDNKKAFQPFSHGPRDCLGKNLAYAEMRVILARIIWNFDLKLAEPEKNWIDDSRVYSLWDKDALNVLLSPRASEAF